MLDFEKEAIKTNNPELKKWFQELYGNAKTREVTISKICLKAGISRKYFYDMLKEKSQQETTSLKRVFTLYNAVVNTLKWDDMVAPPMYEKYKEEWELTISKS